TRTRRARLERPGEGGNDDGEPDGRSRDPRGPEPGLPPRCGEVRRGVVHGALGRGLPRHQPRRLLRGQGGLPGPHRAAASADRLPRARSLHPARGRRGSDPRQLRGHTARRRPRPRALHRHLAAAERTLALRVRPLHEVLTMTTTATVTDETTLEALNREYIRSVSEAD